MPKRMKIRQIPSPELQGDDSWVKVKSPTIAEFKEISAAPERISKRAAAGASAEEVERLGKEYMEMIAEFVIEWNWVDDDGEPLPQPHNNPAVFDDLTGAEVAWIGGCLNPMSDVWQKKDGMTS